MRLARKLFLLSAMALAAVALMATSANAQVSIQEEAGDNHACTDLSVDHPTSPDPSPITAGVVAANVEGGCHVDFGSETGTNVPLFVNLGGGPMEISSCELSLEARVETNGEGWVTGFDFQDPHGSPPVGCLREPCENGNGEQLAWPVHIQETAPNVKRVLATFCVSTLDMSTSTTCVLNLPLTDLGSHNYEVNLAASCINLPPVSISGHLLSNASEGEQIEITHL